MPSRHQLSISVFLIGSWFLTVLVYEPGFTGPFLFDDFPNLEKIGAFGPIENWELFRAYLSSGFAGPSGRPISLLSFLINANDWPADPASFKYTNLLIHLLIGVILFPTIRGLLYAIGRSPRETDWIALIATTLWLLNPFLVSTTLYVVQRMTQLAALFSILGIWGYLQGRLWLPTRPYLGYATLSLSVGLGTVLAVFSKENGALLPLLILTIEFALRFHWTTSGPNWRWTALFLGLPALTIIVYLIMRLPGLEHQIPTRNFSLAERLLTESRILWDYLFHLFIPHIQTQGLYHDGTVISTGFSTPWTTLPALLGILALGIGGWLARCQWPLLSLAILFFLVGQLLESTTIALELYFEHRNYLPAIFLFLPIAAGIMRLRNRIQPALVACIAFALIGSYAMVTWQRARLWSDENQLMLVWAETNPRSPRAQNSAVQTLLRLGQPDRAIAHLEQALREIPDSALLASSYLSLKADIGILSTDEFAERGDRLRRQPFDAQMLVALKYLVDTFNTRAPLPEHTAIMMALLAGIRDDLQGRVPVAHRYTYYLQGLLLSGQGDGEGAYHYLSEALSHYQRVETALHFVSMLATHGHFQQALDMLEQSRHILETQPDSTLDRKRGTYEREIARLEKTLREDLRKESDRLDKKQKTRNMLINKDDTGN
ncbi:MAG: tetratricopeptide repeat protein [Candidatus Competibacteraceae bacterium]|nr:MAG: tetratricopeptide repeat protein [Candidatus Competibacteraceae bacterium]